MGVTVTVPIEQWENMKELVDDRVIKLTSEKDRAVEELKLLRDEKTLGTMWFPTSYRDSERSGCYIVTNNSDLVKNIVKDYLERNNLKAVSIEPKIPWYKKIF